ncbi:MAG: PEP-CTERM sorting domain-containing protein [Gemmatimonadota bacterium]
MVRRFFFAAVAAAFLAQPAFAQAADSPFSGESSDSDDGWVIPKAAFGLTAIGAGAALAISNSTNASAASAPGFVVPSSDSYGNVGQSGTVASQQVPVPEPGTTSLLMAGLFGLLGVGVLRRRNATA